MITHEFFRKDFKSIAEYRKCSAASALAPNIYGPGDATYLFFRICHPHRGRAPVDYVVMAPDYLTGHYYYDSSFITEKLVIYKDRCMALSKQHVSTNANQEIPEEHYNRYYFSMKNIVKFEVSKCSDIQGFYHDWFDMIFTSSKINPTTKEEDLTTFKLMVYERDLNKFLEIFKDHPVIRGYFLRHIL